MLILLFYSSAIESFYRLRTEVRRTELLVWNRDMADSTDWDAEIARNSFYGFQSSTFFFFFFFSPQPDNITPDEKITINALKSNRDGPGHSEYRIQNRGRFTTTIRR